MSVATRARGYSPEEGGWARGFSPEEFARERYSGRGHCPRSLQAERAERRGAIAPARLAMNIKKTMREEKARRRKSNLKPR